MTHKEEIEWRDKRIKRLEEINEKLAAEIDRLNALADGKNRLRDAISDSRS